MKMLALAAAGVLIASTAALGTATERPRRIDDQHSGEQPNCD
jgi:hypothetical protein